LISSPNINTAPAVLHEFDLAVAEFSMKYLRVAVPTGFPEPNQKKGLVESGTVGAKGINLCGQR
jgi:hypothetical protein